MIMPKLAPRIRILSDSFGFFWILLDSFGFFWILSDSVLQRGCLAVTDTMKSSYTVNEAQTIVGWDENQLSLKGDEVWSQVRVPGVSGYEARLDCPGRYAVGTRTVRGDMR